MRKLLITVATGALLTLATGIASAQPPIDGSWSTSAGDFLTGRATASWPSPAGRLVSGNVLNIESFSTGGGGPIQAAALGTQWRVYCPQIVSVTEFDLTFGGTGSKMEIITYVGGFFELSGTGPWGGGDPLYSGVIDVYNETRTIQYLNGVITGANSNHNMSGHLPGFASGCIGMISNESLIGDTDPNLIPGTDTNVKPVDYPDFLDTSCNPTPVYGRWGDFYDVTLTISGCLVPTEEKTWGTVKKLYQE